MSAGFVCIYNGCGTSEECYSATMKAFIKLLGDEGQRRVILISHPGDFVNTQTLGRGNTIVMPGGNARVINNHFGYESLVKVKKFIDNEAGSFIGICAGAILACRPSRVMNRGFAFQIFKGGSLDFSQTSYEIGSHSEKNVMSRSERQIQVIGIQDVKSKISLNVIWWLGGAHVDPEAHSEEVVAYYQLSSALRAAAIQPRKNVLLCSIHPEFQIAGHTSHLDLSEEHHALLSSGNEVAQWFKKHTETVGLIYNYDAIAEELTKSEEKKKECTVVKTEKRDLAEKEDSVEDKNIIFEKLGGRVKVLTETNYRITPVALSSIRKITIFFSRVSHE